MADYRIFSFVRNPFDRAVSIASYFRLDFRRFVLEFDQLTDDNAILRHHALPLHLFTHFDGSRFVDYVGRFESLQSDFDQLMQLLGHSPHRLPHMSRSQRGDFRAHYDDALRSRIGVIYRRDIALFGYAFE